MTASLALVARPETCAWDLLLVGRERTGALGRRVRLVGDELDGFVHRGGQRVALLVEAGGEMLRRVCPIAAFDPEELRLDVTLPTACDPAAERWAEGSAIGERVRVELLG
jgi:hypothetical protein